MRSEVYPSLALRRVGKLVGGGTPSSEESNWDGTIPFVTPPDLRPVSGSSIFSTQRTLTERGAISGSAVVNAGAVLLSIRAPIGYVAQVGMRSAFNQGCRAIIPSEIVDGRFLTYTLLASKPELEALGRGTTFMELSTVQMASFKVPVPSVKTQVLIADYLDRETARIDALIAKQEQLIEKLTERRHAVIDSVLTVGLSADVDFKDSGVKWLGRIPEGWRTKPLWSMYKRLKDTEHPDEKMLSVFRDYGVVLKNSRQNINKTAENRNIYQLVHPGWLVTNRMKAWQGSVGISPHRGIVSGHYLCFSPLHQESNEYLNWLFRSPRYAVGYSLISRGVRIGQAEIDNDDYRVVPVLLPPIAEQVQISQFLEKQTSKIDTLIDKTRAFIALSKERRAALIAAAVTGQINVREVG
ncbi:restriction endonuclease subunit S [Mycetocola saprophilus]|uniref:restriction endonuclease subunit S n=1 Tax=Mycetocola saprophilus TaxID=76636 RepID=UPI0009DDE410|nr:restriction endonuclease subunit S [Mycetocola saprophilus]